MQYEPDTKTPIDEFIRGKVIGKSADNEMRSPSLHALDRRIVIEETGPALSHGQAKVIDLYYASGSYIFFELGKTYLFAVAEDHCLGFLEIQEDRLILPNASCVPLDSFIIEHRGHPFPDYYGFDD